MLGLSDCSIYNNGIIVEYLTQISTGVLKHL